MGDGRQFSAETKARITLEAIRAGSSVEQIAATHGISGELIAEWTRELIAGAWRAFDATSPSIDSLPAAPTNPEDGLSSPAFQESEARLNAIIESAPVGVMFKDRSRRVVLVNKTFCDFLTLPKESILGKRSEEFRPPDVARELRLMDEDVLATGAFRLEEWSCLHRDGVRRSYTTTKFPVRGRDGRIFGMCGVAVDMTERNRAELALRMSEARLAAVINHAPASISLKDVDGRYLLVNQEISRRFGRPVEEFPGRTVFDFTDPQTAAGVTARDREAIVTAAVTQQELAALDNDGVRRTLMVTRFPIFEGDNRAVAIGTISIDISAQKAIEAELRLAKDAAEVASRAKTEFLANMSHELRTPLNSIIGFSHIISEQMFGPTGNPKYQEYAADILNSGRGLLELINDILDVSRIEIGGMNLEENWLEVSSLLRNSAGSVKVRALEAGLDLRIDVPDGIPALKGDARRIRQIVLNLLSNAVKFTPRGGTVTLWACADSADRLVLAVSDTGIGIPADKIETVLSMFGQVRDPMIHSYEGVGLGLPLCKKLAELHGGGIEIESVPGRGTTVRVVFPAERTQRRLSRPLRRLGRTDAKAV